MQVVGIVVGVLLLLVLAAGGALLWWRMRKGLPGVGQEEEGASERGAETPKGRGTDTVLGGRDTQI